MSWYSSYRGRSVGRVLHFVEHYCGLHVAEHATVGDNAVSLGGKRLALFTWSDNFGEFDVPTFDFAPCSETYVYQQRTRREWAILDGLAHEAPSVRHGFDDCVLSVLRRKSAQRIALWAQICHRTNPAYFVADHKAFADVAGRIYQLDVDSGEWMLWYVPNRYQEMEKSMVLSGGSAA